MSIRPLISCIDNAVALCQGVNVAKTESPKACPWDSVSNEMFPLTEGPDSLRILLVRALSLFLFLVTPPAFPFLSGFLSLQHGASLYSHELGPLRNANISSSCPAHEQRALQSPRHGQDRDEG